MLDCFATPVPVVLPVRAPAWTAVQRDDFHSAFALSREKLRAGIQRVHHTAYRSASAETTVLTRPRSVGDGFQSVPAAAIRRLQGSMVHIRGGVHA